MTVLTRSEDASKDVGVGAADIYMSGMGITHLSVLDVNLLPSNRIFVGHHTTTGAKDKTVVVARNKVACTGKSCAVGVDVAYVTAADGDSGIACIDLIFNHVSDMHIGLEQPIDTDGCQHTAAVDGTANHAACHLHICVAIDTSCRGTSCFSRLVVERIHTASTAKHMSAIGVLGRAVVCFLVFSFGAFYEWPTNHAAVNLDMRVCLHVTVLTTAIYIAVDIRVVQFAGGVARIASLTTGADGDESFIDILHAGHIVASTGRHTTSSSEYITVVDTFVTLCSVAHSAACD